MDDTTRSEATTRRGRGSVRRMHTVPLALAALALLGTPAPSAAAGGQKVTVKTAGAGGESGTGPGGESAGKTETRELVVVGGSDDEPGGVWLTKELGGGYLGVELLPMTGQLRAHFGAPADRGVLVARVEEGSPAARAGLQAGDVIVRLDDQAVETPWDLTLAVRGHEKGDTARLFVQRDGHPLDFDVQLDERERRKIDLGQLLEPGGEPGDKGRELVRLRELARLGEGPPVVFVHPEAMDRLGESLDKIDWPRLDERLGERNRELEKRLGELEKRLDELEKELADSAGKPR